MTVLGDTRAVRTHTQEREVIIGFKRLTVRLWEMGLAVASGLMVSDRGRLR